MNQPQKYKYYYIGLGEPYMYHNSGVFYKNLEFYLEDDCEELVGSYDMVVHLGRNETNDFLY